MREDIFEKTIKHSLVKSDIHNKNQYVEPQLISNKTDDNLWTHLLYELKHCNSFIWNIAFITKDMLTPLKFILKDENVHGTIITGTYLGFNSPDVFEELTKIPNLTVKITEMNGFHPKGYIFNYDDFQTAYIGSTNFTRSALLTNCEWNLRITSLNNGALVQQINHELSIIENQSFDLNLNWLNAYRKNYQPIQNINQISTQKIIKPNKMQSAALLQLDKLKENGAKKALIVSATGTGKTYLSAFWTKKYNPKKFLFIVHREEILKKAMQSFKEVIQEDKFNFGFLTGNKHDTNKKYLFATIQTISQDHNLHHFSPNDFDLIIIDEAHRSAAKSYKKVINYFNPNFYLGMTATPERMDDQDIFELFDYNLAYEIRLQDALKANMLCPFHYIGVSDYEYNGETIDDLSSLAKLTSKERVKYVLKQVDYYGDTSTKIHGLVFCSRTEEAIELAKSFTHYGHLAKALTNKSTSHERENVINELKKGKIEYIITVDLFNEGIDIPCLNQIIMLRNTKSSIIFTQQLGRGLRKFKNKDFVTVIDFIGNYQNNYLIPIALNGINSNQKDLIKQDILTKNIVGISTINFTKISKQRILNSLDKVKLNSMFRLKNAYQLLKKQLHRIPLLTDFQQFGEINATAIINSGKVLNYADFLLKMHEDIKITKSQKQLLNFVTQELSNGKRIHELIVLQYLIKNESISFNKLNNLFTDYDAYNSSDLISSLINILSLNFFNVKAGKTTKKEQYGGHSLIETNLLEIKRSDWFNEQLSISNDFYDLLQDAIKIGILLNKAYNNEKQFTLYQKYTRKDVCRLLNWEKDVSAPLYGYRVTDDVCPIFITYKKNENNKRNQYYNNNFSINSIIDWYTRSPRHLNSAEVQKLLRGVDNGCPKVRIEIFVKRSDADGKEFTYLGKGKIIPHSAKEVLINVSENKQKAAVKMQIKLNHPLGLTESEKLFN